MEKATAINAVLLAAASMNVATLFADAPTTDPRYEQLRKMMKEYVQGVVLDECAEVSGFSFDSYSWEDYEIEGLEIILLDTLNRTKNYCKAPELTGMHSKVRAHPGTTSQR